MDHIIEWIEDEQWNTTPPRKPVPVFLRFGKFSRRERSYNWATGEYERGISVYPAVLDNDVVHIHEDWQSDIERYLEGEPVFTGRCVFVLTGKETAKGSDGEPLLQPSSIRVLPYTVALDHIQQAVKATN